jgi:hypothetical protein
MSELRARVRWRLYELIDWADTWCLDHPRTPVFLRVPIGRAWEWMMRQGTWTAVGDDTRADHE